MSRIEIYAKSKTRGVWELVGEVPNAMRGAWMLWMMLEREYLPSYNNKDNPVVGGGYKSRLMSFEQNALDELWDLQNNPSLTLEELIVFRSTMDNTVIMGKDLPMFVKCLEKVGKKHNTNHDSQASLIRELCDERGDDIEAITYNQTSVCDASDLFGDGLDADVGKFVDCMDDNQWGMSMSKARKE